MAVTRTTTYGIGGYNPDLPYNNLMEISYFDDETQEVTVYVPPDIPDPLPPTTAETEPPEETIEDVLAALSKQVEDLAKAVAILQKERKSDREESSHGKEKGR